MGDRLRNGDIRELEIISVVDSINENILIGNRVYKVDAQRWIRVGRVVTKRRR